MAWEGEAVWSQVQQREGQAARAFCLAVGPQGAAAEDGESRFTEA